MKRSFQIATILLAAATICEAQADSVLLFAPGVISRPDSNESFGSLSPNGREFYFTIHRPDFGGQRIVVSRLEGARWSVPQTLPFSGKWNDREPKLSPDGRRLYFSSNRPVSPGDTARRRNLDLWMAERGLDGVWGAAHHIDAPANTDAQEFCPVVVADGVMYFISTRPGGIRAPDGGLHNVWRARPLDRSGLRFSQPENIGPAINSGFETNVYVSPDGRTMLVSRDGAPDGLGGDDLYASTLVGGAWQQLRHLPSPINTDKYEYGPSVSPDGRYLFFTSARAGGSNIYRVGISAIEPVTDPPAQIDAFLRRAASFHQFNGVALVARGDRIIYEKAFGVANMEWNVPNTTESRFEIASMTKPMTAIAIMQLVEAGKVRLDAHVSDYLSFYPRETGERITVDQLLTHTSGLQEDIAFANDPNDIPAMVPLINADLISNDSLVKLIAQRPLRFAPGTSYGYSSDAYAVLGAIIERVSGMPYWRALKLMVLDRAGMTETSVALQAPIVPKRAYGYAQTFKGYENAPHIAVSPAGGLISTARDLYRFDRALTGEGLVRKASRERLFAVRSVATAYGWKTSEEQRPAGSRRTILRTTGALPGFLNLMVRVPSEDRVIIFLSNTRDLVWRLDDFAIAINRILDGEPYALPRQSVAAALASAIAGGARGRALETAFARMQSDTLTYSVSEMEMNQLGYYVLNSLRSPPDAVQIFRMNVEAFPRSANTYDSLGEAYLAARDSLHAIENYRKSLQLDPNNSTAASVLKRLGADR